MFLNFFSNENSYLAVPITYAGSDENKAETAAAAPMTQLQPAATAVGAARGKR